MKMPNWLRRKDERAATLANPPQWLLTSLGLSSSNAGPPVTVKTAMGLVPVYSAVSLLSGAVATLPLMVYREGSPRTRDTDSRAYGLLHDEPNPEMAADECWELVTSHLLTWGNAYLYKERSGDGRVANLWPIDPGRVAVTRLDDGTRLYDVDQKGIAYTEADLLHIRGLSSDGTVGYSPVQLAKQKLGEKLARDEFASYFWANDATPGVVLRHPNKLSDEAAKRLKATWDSAHKGTRNSRSTAVIEEGMDVHTMTVPLADAQFVETEKLNRTEIALLFRVPPYMLAGETGDSLTYSTSETQSLDFVKWSLMRWLVRIEKSLGRGKAEILTSSQSAEFLTDALLRGTTNERYTAFATAPHLLIDEMRELDNLPPLPNGAGQVLSPSTKGTPPANDPNQGNN